jgi:hypothetical protein
MKKLLPTICFLFVYFQNGNLKSQNIYDPYNFATSPTSFPALVSGSGFSGEYQLFLRGTGDGLYYNHWSDIAKSNPTNPDQYFLTYKIEDVSFPFGPNFVSSTPTNRVLHAYSTTDYNSTTNLWDGRVQREYRGGYVSLGGVLLAESINGPSTLVSAEFKDNYPSTVPSRILYPHSILKHTIYLYCDASAYAAGKPIDSLEFIADLTRGKMRNYPFYNVDPVYPASIPASPPQHDILLSSTLDMPGGFDATTNEDEFWNPNYVASPPPLSQSTIDYFPHPAGTTGCRYTPYDYFPTSADFAIGTPNPKFFIHPPSYSLSGYEILNGLGSAPAGSGVPTGIKHQYVIDKPIDLTIINPTQKVIYNPSETNIDLNNPANTTGIYTLTFPTGYVFKTVDGIYPSATQVYNADPDNLYSDPREIPVPTTLSYDDPLTLNDERKSYYYVKSGSVLKIEACVGIYDAVIVVKNGGNLIYDPAQTYGNYSIVTEAGGIVNTLSLMPAVGCTHDCYDLTKYEAQDITITTSSHWTSTPMTSMPYDFNNDGKVVIAGTIRIKANQILTITGPAQYEFGENGRIVVEKGAKLIADGCTFTSTGICKKGMWKGIEVWGDRTVSQTGIAGAANQGVVKLTNVKISNARNGIATRNGSDGWFFNGGMIQCNNVIFENNRRSIEFLSYHNIPPSGTTELKNFSYLKNCQFLTTGYLNDPIYKTADNRPFTVAQVTMWDVKNIAVENCLFENNALKTDGTALFDSDHRGAGIFAIDAGILLYGGTYINEFKGLSDAVWAISTGEPDFVSIQGTDFKNNVHALTLEGVQSPVINLNTFEIPAHELNSAITDAPLQKGFNKPTGLYLIGTPDFTAQENTFTKFGTAPLSTLPEEYNYGMIVNNCSGVFGSNLGYAYKNAFSNMNINLQTELDNRGSVTGSGLEYSCNNFNTRVNFDVTVPDNAPASLYSLLRDQGLCNASENQAGNSYTGGCSGDVELRFDLNSAFYSSGFQYSDQPLKLQCATLGDNDCIGIPTANTCPSNFTLCSTIPCLAVRLQTNLNFHS